MLQETKGTTTPSSGLLREVTWAAGVTAEGGRRYHGEDVWGERLGMTPAGVDEETGWRSVEGGTKWRASDGGP